MIKQNINNLKIYENELSKLLSYPINILSVYKDDDENLYTVNCIGKELFYIVEDLNENLTYLSFYNKESIQLFFKNLSLKTDSLNTINNLYTEIKNLFSIYEVSNNNKKSAINFEDFIEEFYYDRPYYYYYLLNNIDYKTYLVVDFHLEDGKIKPYYYLNLPNSKDLIYYIGDEKKILKLIENNLKLNRKL